MPTAALAGFAKRAGKSLASVEKLWKKMEKEAQARKAAGKLDGSVYQYATGAVKKALKLETMDLITAGIPPQVAIECTEGVIAESVAELPSDAVEKAWVCAALGEALHIRKFGMRSAVFDESMSLRESVNEANLLLVEGMTASERTAYLRKMFPFITNNLLSLIQGTLGIGS